MEPLTLLLICGSIAFLSYIGAFYMFFQMVGGIETDRGFFKSFKGYVAFIFLISISTLATAGSLIWLLVDKYSGQ